MDDPNLPYINASASILGNAMGAMAQSDLNRKTQQWNEKMYGIQRTDALADWTMQNQYNHPSSQMARLREAGLNPNLVYGKGADNTSQAVRSSSAPTWNPKAPDYGSIATQGLSTFVDTQMRQAQIDNLRVANTVAIQDAALKAAQTASTTQQTETGKFNLGMSQKLENTSLQMAEESLRKLQTGTDISLQENERNAAMNSANLKQAAETILNMRMQRAHTQEDIQRVKQTVEQLKKSGTLQQLDIDLKNNGIQPTDNIFLRVLGRLLSGETIENMKKGFDPSKFNTNPKFNKNDWQDGFYSK